MGDLTIASSSELPEKLANPSVNRTRRHCLIAYEHRRGAPVTLIFRHSPSINMLCRPGAFVSPRTLRALKPRLCITRSNP